MSLRRLIAAASLRQRIMCSISALVIVLVAGTSWLLVRSQRTGLEKLAGNTSTLSGSAASQQENALGTVLNSQIQASQAAVRSKAQGLAGLVAKLAPVSLLTFDTNALTGLCEQASTDADVRQCVINDAGGKQIATFKKAGSGAKAEDKDLTEVRADVEQDNKKIGQVVFVVSLASVKQQERDIRNSYAALQKTMRGISGSIEGSVEEQSRTQTKQAATSAIEAGIAAIALGLLSAIWISASITKPLRRTARILEDIAQGEGDLTKRLEISSQDELGEVAKWLNLFLDKLHSIISKVAATAENVAGASEQLSSNAALQAQGAETQKDQAVRVATALQEMSATVSEVAQNSNQAEEAARQAAEVAREGGGIVDETLATMRGIAKSVGGTARKMEELGKSSDQISRITSVIDDIADQTNLLALNAAIEAARAGEQGRGFAVVADEVRKLAERTTAATKEIAQMIRTIQDETKTAVTAMEQGTQEVQKGLESTSRAGASLKQIIHMSERVGEMITHIATAATQQSNATSEINSNMEQIASLGKASADGAQQSAKACQDLSGLATDLQTLVGTFKLDDDLHHRVRRDIHKQGKSGILAFSTPATSRS